MAVKEHKRKSQAILLLAIAGLFVAVIYVMYSSMILCRQTNKDNHTEQNSNYSCRIYDRGSVVTCPQVLVPSPNSESSDDKNGGDKYKYGSWANDFLCEAKASDIAISYFTFCLILVGYFQAFWLEKTVDATLIAANAADRSAKAVIALELPILRVKPDKFGFGEHRDGDGPRIEYCSITSLEFINLGRTKAFPLEIKCGWAVDNLPLEPNYTFAKTLIIDLIYEPDKIYILNINEWEFETGPQIYNRIRANEVDLWFYCSIAYLDFMQTRHDAAFCWKRYETFGAGGFLVEPAPAYNRKT